MRTTMRHPIFRGRRLPVPGVPAAGVSVAIRADRGLRRLRTGSVRGAESHRLLVAACIAAVILFAWGLAAFHLRAQPRRPAAGAGSLPGITLDAEGGALAMLVVTSLRSGGPGAQAGVRVGDRLEAVDGVPVPGRAALQRVLAADGARVMVLHLRRGQDHMDVRIDRGPADGAR